MLTKNQIKEILSQNNLRALKSLGQNFLIDKNIKNKIIQIAELKSDDYVLEIGPGLGALTEDLANAAKKVFVVEKDRGLSQVLQKNLSSYKNITIFSEDILKFDLNKIHSKKIKVIGNLPYYITSPVIFHLLRFRDIIDSILITVQKEVATRMVASPGSKNYGALTLSVLFYTEPTIEMNITRGVFYPQPEINSSLVKLNIRKTPPVSVKNEKLLFNVIRAGFNQRRKTLANALSKREFSSSLSRTDIQLILERSKIDPKTRAETLSLQEFANIANAFDNYA